MESPEAAKAPDIEEKKGDAPTFARARRWAPWMALAVACLGLYFNCMGSWVFNDPGESYYTEAAREMVESNDWIVPHLNYQVYFSKPILTFWLIAASYKIFGISEWAARLPFAMIASLMVFATYAAAGRLYERRTAFLAALIASAVPLTVIFCKTSPIDLLFCTFLNLAVLAFAMSVFAGSRPWAYALWASLALAVVAKGPAGIVFFGLGTALFLLLQKPSLEELKNWFLATKPLAGIPLFIAICLPWYWAVWTATKGLFLQVFFIYENIARLAGKTNLHKSSLIYFIPVLAYGFAPWFLLLPQTIKLTLWEPFAERWFGAGRLNFKSTYRPHMQASAAAQAGKSATQAPKPLEQDRISTLTSFYLASWSLAIFIFFSLSKTQLATYIEPILTPLAVLTAATIIKLLDSQTGIDQKLAERYIYDAKWLKVFAVLCAVLSSVAALACLAGSIMPYMPFYPLQRVILLITSICAIVGSIAQFKRLRRGNLIEMLTAHALTLVAITSGVVPVVLAVASDRNEKNMVALARQLKGSHEEIALFGTYMPSAMYYMQRPVDYLSEVSQFTVAKTPIARDGFSYGPTPSGRLQLILGDDKHMAKFAERPDLKLQKLATKKDWGLYVLTNGYAEKPRRLEETFKYLLYSKHPFTDTESYGPLTVPLGSGDADWYKYRHPKKSASSK
ncbi:MAG: glycosyltransferase family 39 protein [Cyanobacteria bacterium REEB67]|nr:glycosyltransferase family 39 protein [Cyanobacteria bacterium REEB67]